MSDPDLDELRSELAELAPAERKAGRSPIDQRVIAGFEDIQRFVDEHGNAPQHGEERDIFERLYAVRLDRLRSLSEYHELLEPLDRQGLLNEPPALIERPAIEVDLDELRAELGGSDEISELRHVRSSAEKQAADEIASRKLCDDFTVFRPLFDNVKIEINNGIRSVRDFELKSEIRPGSFFIVGGQTAYVADMSEVWTNAQGRLDARLRVIFDNGTESNMLMRSLQRALHKDEAGRRITDPVAGPLFANALDEGDIESGTIYVLRTKSDHPSIAPYRDLLHKIGVTGGTLQSRIANARKESTYLFADVEVVAELTLFNINRTKLEKLLHRFFADAGFQVEIPFPSGDIVKPREWFLVPIQAIKEAFDRLEDGTLVDFAYDPNTAQLVRQGAN
jgi:hypothetical protein